MRSPRSTLFPYTTLFRSSGGIAHCFVGKILQPHQAVHQRTREHVLDAELAVESARGIGTIGVCQPARIDRKSTRLNSSHANISYAVFCLKKKKRIIKSRT